MKRLLEAQNWRIRQAAYEMFANLAQHIKSPEVFESQLQDIFFSYLADRANSIREFGNTQLPVELFKLENTKLRESILGSKYFITEVSRDHQLE